jgi:hypothetical protein
VSLCTPHPGLEPGPPRWEVENNRLIYGTAVTIQ